MPAVTALTTKASTFIRVVLTPVASAATSSSRIASRARPKLLKVRLRTQRMTSAAQVKTQKKVV